MEAERHVEPPESMPESLGPFVVRSVLGAGGMGVVYEGEHRDTGRPVAIKTVTVADPTMLTSIRREIRALSQIEHPGIVHIVDTGAWRGRPWYAMELLRGETLRARLTPPVLTGSGFTSPDSGTRGPTVMASPVTELTVPVSVTVLNPTEASGSSQSSSPGPLVDVKASLTQLIGVCEALSHLHGEGLVHRDLKPENIFIREDGLPVLFDFGLAFSFAGVRGRDVIQSVGRVIGSPGYMAPEQIRGDIVDARADLYALGCMLYEVLTGRLPFLGSITNILSQHIRELPTAPVELAPNVDRGLSELVLRLLSKRPQDRIGFASDVASALRQLGFERPEFGTQRLPRPYLYRPQLSGRRGDLASLEPLLVAAARGRGGRTFIGGVSGVGKTRLALELSSAASRLGMHVVAGECIAIAAGRSGAPPSSGLPAMGPVLHAVRPVLTAIVDHCRDAGPEEAARIFGEHAAVLAPYEPSLAELPGVDVDTPLPQLEPEAARVRLLATLADSIARFAEAHPLLVILDDLQWADEFTLALLDFMDATFLEKNPVVVIGTYRSDETTESLRTTLEGATCLVLDRLDAIAVTEMVCDMLALDEPPAAFIEFLLRQSEGNPFFIAEYLRMSIDEGVLHRDTDGRWRFGDVAADERLSTLPMPTSLRELVGERLGRLSEGARAVAECAAVLGRDVEAQVLRRTTGFDDGFHESAVHELIVDHVLEVAEHDRLRFAHDKLREAAYANIEADELAELHGAAAKSIESVSGSDPARFPELAHHLLSSGQTERAVSYLEKAGEQALSAGAYTEARGFFQRTLALTSADDATALRRARWMRRLGHAHLSLGNLPEAQKHTSAALEFLDPAAPRLGRFSRLLPSAESRFAVTGVADLARQLGRLSGVVRAPKGETTDRERILEAALAMERLSQVHYFSSDPVRSFACALRTANLAERLGPSPILARAFAALGVGFGFVPWQSAADTYGKKAIDAAEHTGDPDALAWALFMRGLWCCSVGRWNEATDVLTRGREIAERTGDRRRVEEFLALESNVANFEGRYDDSLALVDELLASSRLSHNAQGEAWAITGRGETATMQGRFGDAVEHLEAAWAIQGEMGDKSQQIAYGLVSIAHLYCGNPQRAEKLAEATLKLIDGEQPAAMHVIHAYEATAEVYATLWKRALRTGEGDAEGLSSKFLRTVKCMDSYARVFPIGRSAARRLRGIYEWRRGRHRRAIELWHQGVDEADEVGMPGQKGRAHLEIGRHLSRGDARRRTHLLAARGVFASIGATQLLRETDVILDDIAVRPTERPPAEVP